MFDKAQCEDMLAYVIRSLVDLEDEVSISSVTGKNTAVLSIKVDKSDLGKIIGRGGRTMQAIRTIMTGYGAKHNCRVIVETEEPIFDDH